MLPTRDAIGESPPQSGGVRRKILPISRLAGIVEESSSKGLKTVHCHGVFDPIHVGHIRHFEQARKFGDVLVVTVTPDRHVNKGPHRPIFPEQLRAEAVAALEVVDYVGINEWPTAVECIRALKPTVYVKGGEFRSGFDRTGALGAEAEAVESLGGRIDFTDDITFSASRLVNRHLGVFSEEARDYLIDFTARFAPADVVSVLERVQQTKVLVVGDAIVDEYVYCEAIGKSSKEPTLVVKQQFMERFAGGALAVANHLASFVDRVDLVTMLGTDEHSERFVRDQLRPQVLPRFLHRPDAPTILKRRYVESYFLNKLFEVYELEDTRLDPALEDAFALEAGRGLEEYDLVLACDFGHGTVGAPTIRRLCDGARYLVLNTQSNAGNLGYHTVSHYPRADFVCVAENEMRLEARDRRGDLREIMLQVAERLHVDRMVVTRGKHGCLTYSRADGFREVPAFAGQVVDRVGAGDAFLSVASLCMVAGVPMEVAGFIGNVAGAEAVATVGNRTPLQRATFLRHLEHLLK
ncbi:MAG: PfkB family carbohydrate kinase [Planctomycetaceae bacterium]|nr:PfkB family carbohydrate kinase [Planctomycetaceae bacterium]